MEDSLFMQVKSRGRRKGRRKTDDDLANSVAALSLTSPGGNISLSKINAATSTLLNDPYYPMFLGMVTTALESCDIHLSKIVCYGLGNFSASITARYQLSLLILLARSLKVSTELFDPVFTVEEKEFLSSQLKFEALETNEFGKRIAVEPILFYMPHCPHFLQNNLLFTNWNSQLLKNCVILSNSYHELENLGNSVNLKAVCAKYFYLAKMNDVGKEYFIPNTFKYSDIFNDMSILVFSKDKLELQGDTFWQEAPVPDLHSNSESSS